VLGLAPPALAATEPARSADAFVDTIGVNIHLHFTDKVYGQAYAEIIKPKLVELGVRHVRDGAYTYPGANADTFYYERVRELAAAGIRFNLITAMKTSFGEPTDYTKVADVYAWCGGAVASFEGINEPNLQGVPDWVDVTKAGQQALWQTVTQSPELASVKVVGPSPVLGGAFALGDVSGSLHYGNAHPYPGGECPTCGDVYGQTIEAFWKEYTTPSGDKPMVMTETGYHNAIHTTNNHRPASELAAGKYMPRLFLEYFNRNIIRTFSYEFIDGDPEPDMMNPEAHFGLLRNDGSEKPAYKAMQGLIALLADPGAEFQPASLDFTLDGDLDRVHHTLLQKRDGRFFLALWLERSSYDTGARPNAPDDLAARGDLDVPPQKVTLALAETFESAVLHRFEDDGSPSSAPLSLEPSIGLDILDRVQIVELVPMSASGAGGSSSSGGNGGNGGNATDTDADGSCGCRLAPASDARTLGAAALVLALGALRRRGRRQ
jgi:hypothetical protein